MLCFRFISLILLLRSWKNKLRDSRNCTAYVPFSDFRILPASFTLSETSFQRLVKNTTSMFFILLINSSAFTLMLSFWSVSADTESSAFFSLFLTVKDVCSQCSGYWFLSCYSITEIKWHTRLSMFHSHIYFLVQKQCYAMQ